MTMPFARSIRRLGIRPYEVAGLIPILLVAAADRFVNLPARGIWDTDQGVETGAVWNAVVNRDLPVYGSPAYTTGSTFHHGALFYDLMMPFAWLGGGNPVLILAAIALFAPEYRLNRSGFDRRPGRKKSHRFLSRRNGLPAISVCWFQKVSIPPNFVRQTKTPSG